MTGGPVLVTGAAGFIGMHVAERLLERGDSVIGVDLMTDYYDAPLKQARLAELRRHKAFSFHQFDLADAGMTDQLFKSLTPDRVVHLAAQPGVRASIRNPIACMRANIDGFLPVLEGARASSCKHLVFASSSSVYGANSKVPFSENDAVDHPVSLYAAFKKANELMAHTYAHVHRLPVTGLRFFTVYGPWGRPDMAVYYFTKSLFEGTPISVYNHGKMRRDFTYVDDIAEGVVRALDQPAAPDPAWAAAAPVPARSQAPYRIYNIGNRQPVELMRLVATLEALSGRKAVLDFQPMQPGDVLETFADMTALEQATGFRPSTSIETGLARWMAWFRAYHRV